MSDRTALIQPDRGQKAIPVHLVDKSGTDALHRALGEGQRAVIAAQKFEGSPGEVVIVPDGNGWFALAGIEPRDSLGTWCLARLAEVLPGGIYRVAPHASQVGAAHPKIGAALVGWICAQYRFDRYKTDGAGT